MARMAFHPPIVPLRALNPANEAVQAGRYLATTLSIVDTDLAAGNIKEGVVIFGITGTVGVGTLGATQLFYVTNDFTTLVGQTYKTCDGQSGEVPDSATRVTATMAAECGGDGDQRIIYNGVEKVTFAILPENCYGISWEGEGLGSAATLACQVKCDSGTRSVNHSGACYYQTLT